MAWDIVKATPNWDNMQHNAVKKQCFKALAISCYKALKNCEERGPEWSAQIKQRYYNNLTNQLAHTCNHLD